jgi:hypothetical protein
MQRCCLYSLLFCHGLFEVTVPEFKCKKWRKSQDFSRDVTWPILNRMPLHNPRFDWDLMYLRLLFAERYMPCTPGKDNNLLGLISFTRISGKDKRLLGLISFTRISGKDKRLSGLTTLSQESLEIQGPCNAQFLTRCFSTYSEASHDISKSCLNDVMPWACTLAEETTCMFNKITGMPI